MATTTPYGSEPADGKRAIGRATAIAAIAAGLVHVAVAADHDDVPIMLVGFEIVAILQVSLGSLMLWRLPSRRVLDAGLALMAAAIGLWLLSRTVGLGFIPGAHIEPVAFRDSVTVAFELAACGGLLALRSASAPVPGTPLVGPVAVLALALGVPAMLVGGHGHPGGASAHLALGPGAHPGTGSGQGHGAPGPENHAKPKAGNHGPAHGKGRDGSGGGHGSGGHGGASGGGSPHHGGSGVLASAHAHGAIAAGATHDPAHLAAGATHSAATGGHGGAGSGHPGSAGGGAGGGSHPGGGTHPPGHPGHTPAPEPAPSPPADPPVTDVLAETLDPIVPGRGGRG